MKRARPLLLASLILGSLSCQRCARDPVALLERVPGDASGLVLVQPLGAVAATLQAGLTRSRGAPEGEQAVAELKQSLGFDPSTADGWRQAGLDPARPAALVAVGAQALWLLPVADGARALQSARDLATRLWRADRVSEATVARRTGLRLGRAFGDREVALATVVHDPAAGLLLVSHGEGAPAAIEAALTTEPARSLARSAHLTADRARVRQGPVLLWARTGAGSPAPAALAQRTTGAVASLGLDGDALWLEAIAGLQPDAARASSELLADAAAVPDLVRAAGADALLVVAGSADLQALLARLERERGAGDVDRLARAAGLDVDRALLKRLHGGMGAALYLGDPTPLVQGLRSTRQLGRALGQALVVEAVAGLRTGAGDEPALLDAYFRQRGIEPVVRHLGEVEVHGAVASGRDGETMVLHYARQGEQLLLGTGPAERFDAWLQRRADGTGGGLHASLSPPLRALLEAPRGGRLYLSFAALATRLRQLDDELPLQGPTLRSTLRRAAEPLASLGRLGAHLQVDGDEAILRVRLEMQPVAERAP